MTPRIVFHILCN